MMPNSPSSEDVLSLCHAMLCLLLEMMVYPQKRRKPDRIRSKTFHHPKHYITKVRTPRHARFHFLPRYQNFVKTSCKYASSLLQNLILPPNTLLFRKVTIGGSKQHKSESVSVSESESVPTHFFARTKKVPGKKTLLPN